MGHLFSSSEETRAWLLARMPNWGFGGLSLQGRDWLYKGSVLGAYFSRDVIGWRVLYEKSVSLHFWLVKLVVTGAFQLQPYLFTSFDRFFSYYEHSFSKILTLKFFIGNWSGVSLDGCTRLNGIFWKMEFFSDFLTNVLEFPLKFWKESRNQDILSPWVLWLWYFGPDHPKILEKEVRCHLFLL